MYTPSRPEIDHRTMKLIVGVVALTLAPLTSLFTRLSGHLPLASISDSYWQGGTPQSVFIGFLFAIASFLVAYNGRSKGEMALSKVASAAALGVALFPCGCEGHPQIIPGVHYIAATVMFLVLADFCRRFYRRAIAKGYTRAKSRAAVYAACGVFILLSIGVLGFVAVSDKFFGTSLDQRFPTLTFYGEAAALTAFGVSWLMASHVLPWFNRADERFSPLRRENPEDRPAVASQTAST